MAVHRIKESLSQQHRELIASNLGNPFRAPLSRLPAVSHRCFDAELTLEIMERLGQHQEILEIGCGASFPLSEYHGTFDFARALALRAGGKAAITVSDALKFTQLIWLEEGYGPLTIIRSDLLHARSPVPISTLTFDDHGAPHYDSVKDTAVEAAIGARYHGDSFCKMVEGAFGEMPERYIIRPALDSLYEWRCHQLRCRAGVDWRSLHEHFGHEPKDIVYARYLPPLDMRERLELFNQVQSILAPNGIGLLHVDMRGEPEELWVVLPGQAALKYSHYTEFFRSSALDRIRTQNTDSLNKHRQVLQHSGM